MGNDFWFPPDYSQEKWFERLPAEFRLRTVDAPGMRADLDIRAKAGTLRTISVDGPGGAVRLGVGNAEHRGTAWRVWANKQTFDVYVAARGIAGAVKVSLHQTGDWRYQWADDETADRHVPYSTRILDQWSRPPRDPSGLIAGLSIWVPTHELSPVSGDTSPSMTKVSWLSPVPDGEATLLHLVIAQPGLGWTSFYGALPVGGFMLVNGDALLILAGNTPVTGIHRTQIAALRPRASALIADEELAQMKLPRMTLWRRNDGQTPEVWEVRVPPRRRPAPTSLPLRADLS